MFQIEQQLDGPYRSVGKEALSADTGYHPQDVCCVGGPNAKMWHSWAPTASPASWPRALGPLWKFRTRPAVITQNVQNFAFEPHHRLNRRNPKNLVALAGVCVSGIFVPMAGRPGGLV